jgi:hypothetical protein
MTLERREFILDNSSGDNLIISEDIMGFIEWTRRFVSLGGCLIQKAEDLR